MIPRELIGRVQPPGNSLRMVANFVRLPFCDDFARGLVLSPMHLVLGAPRGSVVIRGLVLTPLHLMLRISSRSSTAAAETAPLRPNDRLTVADPFLIVLLRQLHGDLASVSAPAQLREMYIVWAVMLGGRGLRLRGMKPATDDIAWAE